MSRRQCQMGAKTAAHTQPVWLLFASPACGFTRCVAHAAQRLGPMEEGSSAHHRPLYAPSRIIWVSTADVLE